ncbi:MAG: bifunctional glutamate N-acetyltransferase/amino-acid acetyltransferase ArgJ [Dehalococcoidia bacterium]|nr:bifunctional glutamate N-acetyltransferase/amino-acid acetyltransferase ArgJ [Dehalococcoidia bacterium]
MFKIIEDGNVATPAGFTAGAAAACIKYPDRLDVAVVVSRVPAVTAGVFTRNVVRSAAVQVSERRVAGGIARAVIANSGCANACTGNKGIQDAEAVAQMAAARFGIPAEEVLVASTGVIGTFLPLERIENSVAGLSLDTDGGSKFAHAIMTTDTRPKEIAISFTCAGTTVHIGAAAKGSGMIHPDMGTMLCFVTTDACVDAAFLQAALRRSADSTLNMVSVDGDTSPSDTLVILANGIAGNPLLDETNGADFEAGLHYVLKYMAKQIAADGEGATKLIEVTVAGAVTEADARVAARTVAASPLVKTAIHGADPNWGRIVCAVGRSGAQMDASLCGLSLNGVPVMANGMPLPFDEDEMRESLSSPEVTLCIDLGLGTAGATGWGCDLSREYVTINASYTT